VKGNGRPSQEVDLATAPNLWVFFNLVQSLCDDAVEDILRGAEKYLR
jgi:hypothetical protein